MEQDNCYCCFTLTKNRSPCECKKYICKDCFKRYSKYEKECKICMTEFEIEDNSYLNIIKTLILKKYTDFKELVYRIYSLLIIYLCCNPFSIILVGLILVSLVIILPSLIFNIITCLIYDIQFELIILPSTWFGGIIIILFMQILISCFQLIKNIMFDIIILFNE